ncbi:MAG: Tom37 metaxin N-terminal-like domain-containing protein, partial [Myxococcota bacterium]
MLVLMKLPTAWGIRNASAFNLKAEALLKMSGLSYDVVEAMPQKGPKGKMPALVDGEKVIGDSSLIQHHLETVHGAAFDEGLTPRDQADAMAYRKMAEEWLYFINLYVRWIVKPEITRDAFFGAIPWPMRGW